MYSHDAFAHDGVRAKVAQCLEDLQVDGVYGNLQYVAAHDATRVVRHRHSGCDQPALFRHGWTPLHVTLYLRREIFERFGL